MGIDITIQKNKYNIDLNDLIVLGKRINNSKRNFLFISKVLGKHIEVKPQICTEVGMELVQIVNDEMLICNENICIIGFAETATGLGMTVASGIPNSFYITTTREDITEVESIFNFEEEHSHATTHRCFPLDKEKIINADKIILVDDEITTGVSILNIINELKDIVKTKEFIVLTILDWRNSDARNNYEIFCNENKVNINVLSLISGEIKYDDNTIYESDDEIIINEKIEPIDIKGLERINVMTERNIDGESYLCHSGRFGVTYDEIGILEYRCEEIADEIQDLIGFNKKILVLGHGENMYIPSRIASYLRGDVYVKSTTRSPIFCKDDSEYPMKEKHAFYHNNVKYYFYNKSQIEKKYDHVILITENDLNVKLTENMILIRV